MAQQKWRPALLMISIVLSSAAFAGEKTNMTQATGTFDVSMTPASEAAEEAGVTLGQFSLTKTFTGDMVGNASGQMLTATSAVKGSAGYVAIERFSGTVHGKNGTFVLQHTGTMQGQSQALTITIVPDSGTGELAGISGTFKLQIDEGTHHYTLEYSLPEG
ncbi:MAG: DUF3224 domain-containing protein [Pseudomonadota bacterium]